MKSVLIVDDDEACADLLCDSLSRADRFLFTAFTAAQAEKMLASRTFDLVLLDLGLPDGSGIDLLERFTRKHPNTRFVVITGDESTSAVLGAMNGAAHDFVRKPFAIEDLREWVDGWLSAGHDADIHFHWIKPHWVEMSIPCSLRAVDRVSRFFSNLQGDLPFEFRDQVGDCVRELVMNAVEWGGHFDPSNKVQISYIRTERMVQFRIIDPGKGFSFDNMSHAAVGQTSADPTAYARVRMQRGIRPGGLGLVIARSIADDLLYNEAQNEVIFIKFLPEM